VITMPIEQGKEAWHYLYSTTGYRQARRLYLLNNPLCVMCARSKPATVLDHIVPHRGNLELFWDQRNWQGLCDPCHVAVKQAQERSSATPKGMDGWPIE
jgi:5-methylcytosine-specific restriction endonuclease McrA